MTDTLDSRAIRRTDCYAQRFMRAGHFAYALVPAHVPCMSQDHPFSIVVTDGKAKSPMTQHTLMVERRGDRLQPSAKELTINIGDLVLWNSADAGVTAFAVAGEQAFFDSSRLTNECGYSHAFGHAGEYRWKDAHGSGLSGTVTVANPKCSSDADLKRWRADLGKGTVVMIADGKAEPAHVEVNVGQTVFFAVVTSKGVSITDERVLETPRHGDKPHGGGKKGR